MLKKLNIISMAAISIIITVAIIATVTAVPQQADDAVDTAVQDAIQVSQQGYMKWVEFNVPDSALVKSMNIDIKQHSTDKPVSWVEVLSYLACKYGGSWKRYKSKDMDAVVDKLKKEQTMQELSKNMKYYGYYYEAYSAVLGNFLGDYEIEVASPANDDSKIIQERYGLKVFSPIAKNYGYSHYDDFGNSRSFGFARRHLGNDLLGSIGTPIVAVEGGYVECIGWNMYGGWRIGIRSFDKKRYYYYAHLRKNHPYFMDLKQGDIVKSGDVIGYLGMTGYSTKENVNNMTKPHLHFGMELVFDESQKESNNEIWIDVYHIVNLLSQNKSSVVKDDTTKDYHRVYDYVDIQYRDQYAQSKKQ
jgi:murein DD-endopeptidase MepM/ murein hydrolase activator NlpD